MFYKLNVGQEVQHSFDVVLCAFHWREWKKKTFIHYYVYSYSAERKSFDGSWSICPLLFPWTMKFKIHFHVRTQSNRLVRTGVWFYMKDFFLFILIAYHIAHFSSECILRCDRWWPNETAHSNDLLPELHGMPAFDVGWIFIMKSKCPMSIAKYDKRLYFAPPFKCFVSVTQSWECLWLLQNALSKMN